MPTQTELINSLIAAATALKIVYEERRDSIDASVQQALADFAGATANITADEAAVATQRDQVFADALEIANKLTAANADVAGIAAALANIQAGRAGEHLGANSIPDPFYLNDYSTLSGTPSPDGFGDKKIPTSGFRLEPGSQSSIELVSPMWYGFEAPRLAVNTTVPLEDNPWLANPSNPFNRFNGVVGAITKEGGIRGRYYNGDTDGWELNPLWGGSSAEGHILKITCPSVEAVTGNHLWLGLLESATDELIERYEFRAWVYVKKGGLGAGYHAGYNGGQGNIRLTANDCAEGVADHPFQLVTFEVDAHYSGNSAYRALNLTPLYGEENEIYIAAPALYPLRGSKSIARGR